MLWELSTRSFPSAVLEKVKHYWSSMWPWDMCLVSTDMRHSALPLTLQSLYCLCVDNWNKVTRCFSVVKIQIQTVTHSRLKLLWDTKHTPEYMYLFSLLCVTVISNTQQHYIVPDIWHTIHVTVIWHADLHYIRYHDDSKSLSLVTHMLAQRHYFATRTHKSCVSICHCKCYGRKSCWKAFIPFR